MWFSGYFDKSHRSTDQIRLDVFKVQPAITSTCRENAALLAAFSRNTDHNEGFEEHSSKIINGAPTKFVDVFFKVRPAVTSTFALFVEKVHFLHLVR